MMCDVLKPRAKWGGVIFVSMFVVAWLAYGDVIDPSYGIYYTLVASLITYFLLSPYLKCLDRYEQMKKNFF